MPRHTANAGDVSGNVLPRSMRAEVFGGGDAICETTDDIHHTLNVQVSGAMVLGYHPEGHALQHRGN